MVFNYKSLTVSTNHCPPLLPVEVICIHIIMASSLKKDDHHFCTYVNPNRITTSDLV